MKKYGYTKVISRTNGEIITAAIKKVDREAGKVTIDIPDYNSSFTFVKGANFAQLANNGRNPINSQQSALLHLSQTVYREIAKWAWAILIAPRGISFGGEKNEEE